MGMKEKIIRGRVIRSSERPLVRRSEATRPKKPLREWRIT
jgi:hypothetical protein